MLAQEHGFSLTWSINPTICHRVSCPGTGHQELVVILACVYLVKSKDQGGKDVHLLVSCCKASDYSFACSFPFPTSTFLSESRLAKTCLLVTKNIGLNCVDECTQIHHCWGHLYGKRIPCYRGRGKASFSWPLILLIKKGFGKICSPTSSSGFLCLFVCFSVCPFILIFI